MTSNDHKSDKSDKSDKRSMSHHFTELFFSHPMLQSVFFHYFWNHFPVRQLKHGFPPTSLPHYETQSCQRKFANSFLVEVKEANSNTAKVAKWAATSRDLMPDDHQKVFGGGGDRMRFFCCFHRLQLVARWWFQILFIFTLTWGDDPISLIFFKWVETTN